MWGCDCDGESHLAGDADGVAGDNAFRTRHLHVIQKVTGFAPPTCPWRAYYDPLVREVVDLWWAEEHGNMAAVLGDAPPGILVDAVGAFSRALKATMAEDSKLANEERKRAHEAHMARQRNRG
jgi:hypothetical protein